MEAEALAALRETQAELERKLAKRERSGSYGSNVIAIKERLAEIERELADG